MNGEKIFWRIVFFFFVAFITIFMASSSGYYEHENKTKMKLTENQMKKFEEDVAAGKNINLKNYLKNDDKNYENKVTIVGDKLSKIVNKGVSKGLEGSFKLIEKLLE